MKKLPSQAPQLTAASSAPPIRCKTSTRILWPLACCAFIAIVGTTSRAEEFEAIASKSAAGYARKKLPDGSYEPETYTFAKGGIWKSGTADKSIDDVTFLEVARTLAVSLQKQNYVPSIDAAKTKLLVMVYWGRTDAPEHASDSAVYQNVQAAVQLNDKQAVENQLGLIVIENQLRDQKNRQNAAMLGYDSSWETAGSAPEGTALSRRKHDLMDELEASRYFIVLMAYDFQLLWKQRRG